LAVNSRAPNVGAMPVSRVVTSRRERGESVRNGSMSAACQTSSRTISAALSRNALRYWLMHAFAFVGA